MAGKQLTAADEKRLDPIVEDDTRRGWRVTEVPAKIQAFAAGAMTAPFTHIRMVRITNARRRTITEVVQRAWVRDMQDPEIWTDAQVLEATKARGSWTEAHEQRLAALRDRTTTELAAIYHEGELRKGEWLVQLEQFTERFEQLAQESADLDDALKAELRARFQRWSVYVPERQAEYQAAYPEALHEGLYYPDRDLNWLLEQAPTLEAADLLEDIHALNDKIQRYVEAAAARTEYATLLGQRLRLFANTVETRQANAEQMATIYYTTQRCDADGNELGPLTPTFEALYDLVDEVITWLIDRQYFFQKGVPDEMQELLEVVQGFQEAGPTAVATTDPASASTPTPASLPSPEASGDSPAATPSSSDGPLSTGTPASSSA